MMKVQILIHEEILKVGINFSCLTVILIDFVFQKEKKKISTSVFKRM